MLSRLYMFGRVRNNLPRLVSNCCELVPSFVRFQHDKCDSSSDTGIEMKQSVDKIGLDLSFNNSQEAFRSKYNSELLRGYIVYLLCSSSVLVENNVVILNIAKKVLGKRLFEYVMKKTVYGHFVAGEDKYKIIPLLERMCKFGVYPVLDYSVEEDISEKEAIKREFEGIVSEVERTETKKSEYRQEVASVQKSASLQCSEGTDVTECIVPQYKYHNFGDRRREVASARTYFYINEEICDRNLEVLKECVEIVGSKRYGPGVAAIKLTALGRPQLLMQLSEVIVKARKFVAEIADNPNKENNVLQLHLTEEQLLKGLQKHGIQDTGEFVKNVIKDKEGVMHLFPWFGIIDQDYNLSETFRIPSLKDGRMVRLITQLTSTEEDMFRNFLKRLNAIFTLAKNLKVPVMVDAEQTYFQPAISRITMEMMHKYNTESMIVLNTYQCYLKHSFTEAQNDLEQARRENFYFGAKLVRGAYLNQERLRAEKIGYADPTCESFDATTLMLNKTFDEFMKFYNMYKKKGEPDRIRVMLASHNEDSVRYVIQRMNQEGITPQSGTVFFGQLLGMCDFITFPLGQSGYLAYKYVPYGPVAEVLPYLGRRLIENKSSDRESPKKLGNIGKEKGLILKELSRRYKVGQIKYNPEVQLS